jgi:hypothetical protein
MFRATHRSSSRAQNCNWKFWLNQRLQLQFLSSWWWAVCRSKHVEQLRNIGIINSTTRSHLVSYFYRIWLNQRLQLQFLSSWWWAVCRSKHVEQLRHNGIINSTTRSHLVGYFYTVCIMMHGSMNINGVITKKTIIWIFISAAQEPKSDLGRHDVDISWSLTRQDSSERVISSSHRPLSTQQTINTTDE